MNTVPKVLERLPGKLPVVPIPNDTDPQKAAKYVLDAFPNLEARHFTKDAIWRDSFALTGTLRTFYSGLKVAKMWQKLSSQHEVLRASRGETAGVLTRINQTSAWIEVPFIFFTANPATVCSGSLSLVPGEDGTWRIWVMKTILDQISGQGNVDVLQPALESANDRVTHTKNGSGMYPNGTSTSVEAGLRNDATNVQKLDEYFQCIVIGGGQSGLSVGGRLQALGVSYVILDKLHHVGDSWRQRYQTARLHTIREFSHLPFDRTFGPEYEEYLHKDSLGRGHQDWAERFGINIWNSTTIESGTWDEERQLYRVKIQRDDCISTVTASHIVFATGANSQTPVMPDLPGKGEFKGTVLHSAEYENAAQWAGMRGVVVGAANTAHDIADDMLESGMNVTMVQRNRTLVIPAENLEKQYRTMYNKDIPTEISDRMLMSGPMSISRLLANEYFHTLARAQPERWADLEKAGFKADPFGDVIETVNVRLGGHYIDIGTSTKISQGRIKVKSDALAIAYTKSGLAFSDGTELQADVIVFGTGFVGNMRLHVEQVFGKEVAERAGDCFGVNEEGEILGAFKPVPQPGLWYIGGSLGMSRYYSRFIALSIKAATLGTPLPIYKDGQHKLSV